MKFLIALEALGRGLVTVESEGSKVFGGKIFVRRKWVRDQVLVILQRRGGMRERN